MLSALLLLLLPEPAFAVDISSGGTTLAMANTALDATLVVVAAAMFCASSMLIVQRFLSTNEDMASSSFMYKRIAGMMAILFTICFLARAGTSLATAFSSTSSISWFGTSNEMVIKTVTQGQDLGGWADGTSMSYGDLEKSRDLDLSTKAEQKAQRQAAETEAAKEMYGDVIGGGTISNLHQQEDTGWFGEVIINE